MIRLHTFAPLPPFSSFSPFGLKVEAYMRLTKVEHEVRHVVDPRKGPKQKLPFLEDGATRLGDSQIIVEYLKRKFGDPLDQGRPAEALATAHAARRMCEEGLYFILLYAWWIDDAFWPGFRDIPFGKMPAPLRAIAEPFVRRKIRGQLQAQGTLRHTREEIYAFGKADLEALSALIGDKPFLLGDAPCSADATLYAFLAPTIVIEYDTPLRRHALTKKNLVSYVARMRELIAT